MHALTKTDSDDNVVLTMTRMMVMLLTHDADHDDDVNDDADDDDDDDDDTDDVQDISLCPRRRVC